jgi:REP element-mobilizing transposase RayT
LLEDGLFDPEKPWFTRWGDLPHMRQDGALYFVTFRLADSLPQTLLSTWRHERDEWRRNNPAPSPRAADHFARQQRRKLETWLDRGYGSRLLSDPRAAAAVAAALNFFDGVRYELGAHVVAANHVHAILRTAPGVDPSTVVHSWKRHSARELTLLGLWPGGQGHLWQRESFDHIVRNRKSLERFTTYIQNHRRA